MQPNVGAVTHFTVFINEGPRFQEPYMFLPLLLCLHLTSFVTPLIIRNEVRLQCGVR